jgi:hypothetical protein
VKVVIKPLVEKLICFVVFTISKFEFNTAAALNEEGGQVQAIVIS